MVLPASCSLVTLGVSSQTGLLHSLLSSKLEASSLALRFALQILKVGRGNMINDDQP